MAYLTRDEILAMGFKYVGENTLLSDKASYYNCKNIVIGSNSRIDDFAVLSAGDGGIIIEDHVHIAVYSSLIGAKRIKLKNFSGISSHVAIYSSSDDYSGNYMTNPTVPSEFTNVSHGDVTIGQHVIVGSGSIILPNTTLEDGVAIGALSLVNKSCEGFYIYSGTPVKKIKQRSQNLLKLEEKLIEQKK